MSRTVNEALKIAQRKVRPIDIEKSTGEPRTVPEKPETIRMQLRQLANGKRAGVFVARGTKGVTLPEGMRVAQMREGNIIFDPSVISKKEVLEAAQSGRLNELLGYIQSKPEALAQSLELGELPRMVISRDENGVEQDSAAVSPDRAEEQAAVFADRARGGSTISTEHLNDGVLRDRMAEGGVPDEESQEEFLKKELEGSAPQYDPEAGLLTGKKAALFGAGLLPGSGIASAAGKFPTAEGGFEPSAKEDWKAGRYGSAALKAAGAAGDVVSAIPVAGTAAGALLKAPLAAKMAMAAAPMAKIAKEAAPVAKAVEEAAPVAKEYQRLVNPAGFYSRAHEVASTVLPEGPRTWQEMRSLMMKQPGMKEQEMHWSGLHPEAYDPSHKITREEIAEQVEKNFPQVGRIVKGGQKSEYPYREADEWQTAISRAERAGNFDEAERLNQAWERFEGHGFNEDGGMAPMHERYTVPGGQNYSERVLTHEYNPGAEDYTGGKFQHTAHLGDINNPIVHTRNSERVGPNGEKILHQEELQSDWGQQGREKGFKGPNITPEEEQEYFKLNGMSGSDRTEAMQNRLDALTKKMDEARSGIPNAPFVGDTEHWLELAAKDTLAHAIENDFDKIFITGGQEQAKRWSNELRKAVDNVRWEGGEDAIHDIARDASADQWNTLAKKMFNSPFSRLDEEQSYEVEMTAFMNEMDKLKGARIVHAKPTGSNQEYRFLVKPVEGPNGKPRVEVVDSSIPSAKGETLSAVVGGDLAKRIMAEESGNVPMKGYRMGSEGYTQTYERKAPSVYKKLMKLLDPEAKVEAGYISNETATGQKVREFLNNFMSDELTRIAHEEYGVSAENLTSAQKEDILADVSMDARQAALREFGHDAVELSESTKPTAEPVHGTYLHITPKMKEAYRKLKAQHGSVFPAYKKGGTVDAPPNSRYTGADRRLLERALHLTRKLTE